MTSVSYGRAVAAIGLVLLTAACSSNSPSGAAPWVPFTPSLFRGAQGWPAPDKAKKPILFVADAKDNVVRMYDPNTPNPPVEGEITDGVSDPLGLAVDSKGSLYVSNVSSRDSGITIYSPGQSKPRLTIPSPGYYGLAVDSKGDIFASNTEGTVSAYKPGAKKPYETIDGFVNPRGIAVDARDNVWVADNSASKVWEIPAGTKQLKDSGLENINDPNGIAFGPGNILYVSNFGAYNASVYKPGSKKPAYAITDGITGPLLNGVTAAGLFFQANGGAHVVGYKPGENKPFSTITDNGAPTGIASSPDVKK
jgi:hypothetical protein